MDESVQTLIAAEPSGLVPWGGTCVPELLRDQPQSSDPTPWQPRGHGVLAWTCVVVRERGDRGRMAVTLRFWNRSPVPAA